MSKNQLLILKEESYLSKVADISAGSYLIEQRTQAINQAAWKQFQTLESNGGLLDIVANGTLWMLIAEQANQLIEAYRSGKRVLIGVNKYPNPIDMPAVHDQQQTINYEHGLQSLKLAQIIL